MSSGTDESERIRSSALLLCSSGCFSSAAFKLFTYA